MDTRQVVIGLEFTVGAMSIAFAILFVALWLAGTRLRSRTVRGRRTQRVAIGMLFLIGYMQLLVASMFTWPAATILIVVLFIPAVPMALAFPLLTLLPALKQGASRLDELS